MRHTTKRYLLVVIGLVLLCFPLMLHAMTAHEILEQVIKQNFGDTFRVVLTVKTQKGKKVLSDHVLWLIGKTDQNTSTFFLDFEEPKDSKGLRFLFEVEPGKDPKAFMYLPAAGKTLPLAVDDPSVDIGATGLTMEDIQGFVPKGEGKETILREEKLDGRDCYVISISLPDGQGERLVWVSKNDFLIIKSQKHGSARKVKEDVPCREILQNGERQGISQRGRDNHPGQGDSDSTATGKCSLRNRTPGGNNGPGQIRDFCMERLIATSEGIRN